MLKKSVLKNAAIFFSVCIIAACGGAPTSSSSSSNSSSLISSLNSLSSSSSLSSNSFLSSSSALNSNFSSSSVTSSSPNEPLEAFLRPIDISESASLAVIDPQTGKLRYGLYANQGQANRVHIVPDFSHAGYMGGGVALPDHGSIPVRETLSPSGGDDAAQIQAAIDRVAVLAADNRGIKGAVLLSAGAYSVGSTLNILDSGVVLRGEGQGESGTVVRATMTTFRATVIDARGSGSGLNPRVASNESRTRIADPYLPVGSTTITLASATGYSVGDRVAILRTPSAAWLGEGGVNTAIHGWTIEGYKISSQATILAVDGNRIAIDIPIMDTIEAAYGGGEVYRVDTSARLQQVGVENLRIETLNFDDASDENRAYYAIQMREVENAWVRDVTVRYFSHGFTFNDGVRFVTAQDLAYLDPDFTVAGGYHYVFNLNGGNSILFQRCYANKGRHTFVSGSGVQGPNVFLDCLATNVANDSGPHHRWSTGTLYDNTKGGALNVQNRRGSGSGHGWAGAQQMFWNSSHATYIVQAPVGAMNWTVGIQGDFVSGVWQPEEPRGMIESHNAMVQPRSLYLQQLQDRLGVAAVNAVTIPQQREGDIWNALVQWGGEGKFDGSVVVGSGDAFCDSGVLSGAYCCSATCGFCGGSGCGALEGTCCGGGVEAVNRSCDDFPAPCTVGL